MTGTRDPAGPLPLRVGVAEAEGVVLACGAPGATAAPAVAAFASTTAPVIKAAGAAADRILAFLRILPPLFASVWRQDSMAARPVDLGCEPSSAGRRRRSWKVRVDSTR
jgi:hypothetical protein